MIKMYCLRKTEKLGLKFGFLAELVWKKQQKKRVKKATGEKKVRKGTHCTSKAKAFSPSSSLKAERWFLNKFPKEDPEWKW